MLRIKSYQIAVATTFLSMFLMTSAVHAATEINVTVNEQIRGDFSSITYNVSDLSKFTIEFYNSGSVPYKARARVDIFNSTDLIFTGWGGENILIPGNRGESNVYWYSDVGGEFNVRVRSYFGNELNERNFVVEKSVIRQPESAFAISQFRVYNDLVIFDIESSVDAKNIIIIPDKYPQGWIFNQAAVGDIEAGGKRVVILDYDAPLWSPDDMQIIAVSEDGKYSTTFDVKLEKLKGLEWLIFFIIDTLKISASR